MRVFLEIFFKRRLQIIAIFAFCILFTLIGSYLVTPLYESEARMLVRVGREATLPPTAMTQPLNILYNRGEQINSQIQILRSRYIIENALAEIPEAALKPDEPVLASTLDYLRYAVRKPLSWVTTAIRFTLEAVGIMKKLTERERLVLDLEKKIGVERIRDTDVLQVTFQSPNPEFAKLFLTFYIEAFLKASAKAMSIPGSVDFFTGQVSLVNGELTKAEDEMAAFRQKWNIYDLRVQKENTARDLTILGSELRNTQVETTILSGKLKDLNEKAQAYIETALPADMRNDQAVIELLKNLVQLKVRYNQMRENLGDKHPDIIALKNEIVLLRKDIHLEAIGIVERQLAVLKNKEVKLLEQENQLFKQVRILDEKGIEMGRYERQTELLSKAYRSYVDKHETSRIDNVMDQKDLTSVSIVQPPLMPFKPVYPRMVLNLLLAIFVGLTLGIVYAFTSEHLAGTVNQPDDLKRELKVPFAISIRDVT
jgi:uncharacterized protein involved in exopolysaccharide biosynthesis